MSRFVHLSDSGRYDEWIELFTDDATYSYADDARHGRAEILALTEPFPAFGKHLCLNTSVVVDGDAADAVSDFVKIHPGPIVQGTERHWTIVGAGRYLDRFARVDGEWRLAARRVEIE